MAKAVIVYAHDIVSVDNHPHSSLRVEAKSGSNVR